MKRRRFFTASAAGMATLAMTGIPGVTGCTSSPGGSPSGEKALSPFELEELGVIRLGEMMASGEITSESLCAQYLDRMATLNPLLHAVMEVNPEALEMARRLDRERREGKVRGPLHGIPVVIKDNIDTGDQMQTTAGSLALEGHRAAADAPLVARLREAGALLLGKTNLSEWANFRSDLSSSGWSGRGGQARNPYALDRSPCGSSSGTAVAVSANLCTLGIGTETNGSIVCPSGVNGIVGIKPTLGLWSRRGIVPIAHSQDTAGPMGRSVTDAALLLGALAAFDDQDAPTHIPRGTIFNDYTPFLDPDGLKNARIGIAREMLGFHPAVDELFRQAVELLNTRGAEVIDDIRFPADREAGAASYQVLLYEFKADLNAYLAAHPNAPVKSLSGIIAFNEAHREKEMPWFGQEIFLAAEAKGDLDTPEYLEALAKAKKGWGAEGIDAVMADHRLDAIIAATNGPAWTIDPVNGDHFSGSSSSPAAISGYPNITVPMGFVHGLPVGLSFFGKAWSEPLLLKLAYAFEQASLHRKPPAMKNTL